MKKIILFLIVLLILFLSCEDDGNVDSLNHTDGKGNWLEYRGNQSNSGFSNNWAPENNPIDAFDSDEYINSEMAGMAGQYFDTSPVVKDNTLFIGTLSGISTRFYHLTAYNISTGDQIWRFKTEQAISNPTISNNTVFFGTHENKLYALDINTGLRKWEFNTSQGISSNPKVYNGIVFFGCNDGFTYAVDANSGNEIWKFDGSSVASLGVEFTDGFGGTPVVHNNLVYVMGSEYFTTYSSNQRNQSLYALDVNTGEEVWRYKTEFGSTSARAISNGLIVFTTSGDSSPSYCYAIDINTGIEKWKTELDWFPAPESSPAVAYGKVFITTYNNSLYAFDINSGQMKWKANIGVKGVQHNNPTIANNMVFIGGGDGYMYAFDVITGQEKWKYGSEYGSSWFSEPIVANGMLIYENGGYLTGLK